MTNYEGKSKDLLESVSAEVGARIKVKKGSQSFEGILMPRTEGRGSDHVVLKLDNGYNIGIKATENTEIEKIEKGKEPEIGRGETEIQADPEKPEVTIIGTGGTVASRIDYRTGAVHPAFSASEIYSSAPEIAEVANIKANTVSNVLSENMTPDIWEDIGSTVVNELENGADGIVIAHGTDTMGYTASALSFMLKDLSKPVILIGSQRSSDRPSSDAVLNLVSAVNAAVSDISGVFVLMHGSTEDEFCLIHEGTKVRKCHTSRRDAFQTVNDLPVGRVEDGDVEIFQDVEKDENERSVDYEGGFDEKVSLLKVHPGIKSEVIDRLLDEGYRGIVLEGTGLGHVPESLYSGIERAIEEEVPVAMTSQCIWGRTNMKVYSTGRDLLEKGVFSLEDMLPETAYVKMMWVLDKTKDAEEVEEMMKSNLAGEISPRSRPDVFLKPRAPGDGDE